jgi:RNA polymerase sigma factor (sigma-70 family)
MQARADAHLLRDYVNQGSEAAFGEIVARYTDLIYSTVLRQTRSSDLAEEIAQSVFTDLARKAPLLARKLDPDGTIVGWVYRSSRFALSKQLRAAHRRRIRESQAMQDFDSVSAASPDWERVRPVLDEALAELGEDDRQAMLLRFFQNQGFQAVGSALGISGDAAQKRVARALEKLRARMARHGITTTASMLSAVLSTNAIETAPAGLAARLAGSSLAGAAAKTGAALTLMTLTSFKTGIVATGIATAMAVWLAAEHRSLDRLREENAALREEINPRSQPPPSMPVALGPDSDALERARREHAELLRLRGEVGVLRDGMERKQGELAAADSVNANMVAAAKAQATRALTINTLKQVGLACYGYANNNSNTFPTSFGQLQDRLAGLGSPSGVGTNAFEFYDYGQPLTTTNAPYLMLAREKQPRQLADGTWSRMYLLADGSVQEASPEDGDFDAWEKAWIQNKAAEQAAASQQAADATSSQQ